MKNMFNPEFLKSLLVVYVLVGITACAAPGSTVRLKKTPALAKVQKGWWYARFKVNHPEYSNPLWYVDVFIAEKVIRPELLKYGKEIQLWRFHRRAAADKTGHQFSFLFYASPQTALEIYSDLEQNYYLKQLVAKGFVIQAKFDDPHELKKPNIWDTSDPHWFPEIQRTWPYFIMGASKMWLELINDISNQLLPDTSSLTFDSELESYRIINDNLTNIWEYECAHALLHHLNALFGYAPLRIRKADLFMRF